MRTVYQRSEGHSFDSRAASGLFLRPNIPSEASRAALPVGCLAHTHTQANATRALVPPAARPQTARRRGHSLHSTNEAHPHPPAGRTRPRAKRAAAAAAAPCPASCQLPAPADADRPLAVAAPAHCPCVGGLDSKQASTPQPQARFYTPFLIGVVADLGWACVWERRRLSISNLSKHSLIRGVEPAARTGHAQRVSGHV
jgi:hypothetical protein